MSAFYDDFIDVSLEAAQDTKPFAFINHKDPEELLEWLNNEFENRRRANESRMRVYREHMALYKGIHYRYQDTRDFEYRRNTGQRTLRTPKVVVNFVYEMVEAKISKMSRQKPSIAVLPNNNEHSDKVNARLVKKFIDNRWNEVNIEDIFADQAKYSFIFGDGYVLIEWDPEAGEVHPLYEQYKDEKGRFPEVKDGKLTGKMVDRKPMIGDVTYKVYGPDRVYPPLFVNSFDEADDVFITEYIHIDKLKSMYPSKAEHIKATSPNWIYDYDLMREREMNNEVMIYKYYHKKTKFLPEGRAIIATDSVILEDGPIGYEHGELPLLKLSDIDVPGEFYGRSFITHVRTLQRHHNNLSSSIARNHGMASHPKWMMPKGACSVNSLGNDLTVVEYTGPQPPVLVQSNPTPVEVFEYQDKLERYIEKMSAIYGVSRGEPPRGVKAAVALQFLDEQEQQRESRNVAKWQKNIRLCAKMTLSLMKQFYKPEDGRTIRIIGKDNTYMLKSFAKADFESAYDVIIQNSSSLPDSKAARIQAIIDLNMSSQTEPIFSKEEVIDMLDLGNREGFIDEATVAARAADSIYESIINGEEVPEPQPYDDLLTHYKAFTRKLQARTFKEELPSEIQQKLISRIKTIEGLMFLKQQKNPVFAQKLMMLDNYPIFFTVPEAPTESEIPVPEVEMPEGQVEVQNIAKNPSEQGEN